MPTEYIITTFELVSIDDDTPETIQQPEAVPQPFNGYYCQIEYTDSLPVCGQFFAAVRTPLGLTLGFLRALPHGRLRLDAFDGSVRPYIYDASEVEVVGHVVLTPMLPEGRTAA